ncbi:hypothetical protein V7S43_010195 [Phytophthora oleae]|uniref:Winged helix-turn helix domain-containing protein n=1 Tax=Phytophthora oleae TaxID=2107226 RepID=A0ABD3FHL1_9STRA
MLYDDATIRHILRAARAGEDWMNVAVKNDVNLRSAYRWISAVQSRDEWESSLRKFCGGKHNAMATEEHVDYLLSLLGENCYLTLDELVDALEARFDVKVTRQTIKHHVDGRMYPMKQTHRDNNYRNLVKNKALRCDYIVIY